jgi:hypothetical protein
MNQALYAHMNNKRKMKKKEKLIFFKCAKDLETLQQRDMGKYMKRHSTSCHWKKVNANHNEIHY